MTAQEKEIMSKVFSNLGKRGREVRSKEQAEASRKNGKLGGRPKKKKEKK